MANTETPVRLAAGAVIDTLALELPLEQLPAEEIRAGAPRAGSADIDAGPGLELGVWEMTAGTAVDVEADECFVVLRGSATVTIFSESDEPDEVLELRPGSLGRLAAGMRTEWVIHEDLRKVYILPVG
ncbi:MAG: cupin domain-containing protein [Leucobacter sp.]